jgi:hypothetical protein
MCGTVPELMTEGGGRFQMVFEERIKRGGDEGGNEEESFAYV